MGIRSSVKMTMFNARRCGLIAAAAFLGANLACGSSSTTPTSPGNTTPTVVSVAVTGTTPAIPIATQFTATATMSDNTTVNATANSSWSSSNVAVATAVAGLVTPLSAGDVTVTATYLGIAGKSSITIAKPLPYTVSGIVTDAATGAPLVNIAVGAIDITQVIQTAQTSANGSYSIPNLLAGTVNVAAATQQNYFASKVVTISLSGNTTVNIQLQHF